MRLWFIQLSDENDNVVSVTTPASDRDEALVIARRERREQVLSDRENGERHSWRISAVHNVNRRGTHAGWGALFARVAAA